MAEGLGLTVTLWAILGGGLLSGKYRRGEEQAGRLTRGGGRILTESSSRHTRILDAIETVAKATGYTSAQVAIAWVRIAGARRHTSVIPILGARTASQLQENLQAWSCELAAEHLQKLDVASFIEPGFPHELLQSEAVRQLGSAGRWEQIDRPWPPPA
jgi:aryl-alcohol dehydrogenase-like predicted oxidoreductase